MPPQYPSKLTPRLASVVLGYEPIAFITGYVWLLKHQAFSNDDRAPSDTHR
jgi:hypothetical protein